MYPVGFAAGQNMGSLSGGRPRLDPQQLASGIQEILAFFQSFTVLGKYQREKDTENVLEPGKWLLRMHGFESRVAALFPTYPLHRNLKPCTTSRHLSTCWSQATSWWYPMCATFNGYSGSTWCWMRRTPLKAPAGGSRFVCMLSDCGVCR